MWTELDTNEQIRQESEQRRQAADCNLRLSFQDQQLVDEESNRVNCKAGLEPNIHNQPLTFAEKRAHVRFDVGHIGRNFDMLDALR